MVNEVYTTKSVVLDARAKIQPVFDDALFYKCFHQMAHSSFFQMDILGPIQRG